MRNLDTSLLRAFVAVAETASMTAAANVLHLTQAAVSQQIKRLEDALGCLLFTRDRRGLRLTGAGERLFGQAKRLLALNDAIWSEMTAQAVTGEVRLGIPHDLVSTHLPPALKAYTAAHPQVMVTLVCRASPDIRRALAVGEIDLAVVEERGCDPGGETLAVEQLVWVGARGGGAFRRRPLPVSVASETCAFRPTILEVLRTAEMDWRAAAEISDVEALNATVYADLAVAALLASTVPAGIEVLGPADGLPPLPPFRINLYRPRTGASPAAEALAQAVRETFLERVQRAAA
jgi:DNA-binding transcriptional LysR family regulator